MYTFRPWYCIYQLLQKTFYCNDHTITEFGIIDSINSSTAYVIQYELIDTWFLDSNRRVGLDRSHGAGTSSPSHWQQVEEQASIPVGWTMCFLLMTFVPVQKLCVNIYIYIYAFLYEFCYRTYIYIQQECNWVLVQLHPITFYKTVFLGECAVPGLNATFCFLWFTNCVLLSDDKSLIPGCLWLFVFVLNNTFILGIWCSTIPHLPRCFCPWTFFQTIGFNMVPTDPFMSLLATQLRYSAEEFQALQLIVLAVFGVVD